MVWSSQFYCCAIVLRMTNDMQNYIFLECYFDHSLSVWFHFKWFFWNCFFFSFRSFFTPARVCMQRQKPMSISRWSAKWFDSTTEIPLWSRRLFECTMSSWLCWIRFKWSTGKTEVILHHNFWFLHKMSTLFALNYENRCLPDGNWSGPVPQCRNYEEV